MDTENPACQVMQVCLVSRVWWCGRVQAYTALGWTLNVSRLPFAERVKGLGYHVSSYTPFLLLHLA